jgi:hypothetical protein
MRTYHDGYKMVEPVMLFNLTRDPHEQNDLSAEQPGHHRPRAAPDRRLGAGADADQPH